MASQIAWLDFDAEQQRRTQLMMAALSAQSTVDELGLGTIRDLIANRLHPNMTVLLTRARYLLFVPRIYSALTSAKTEALIAEGRKAEGKLIERLVAFYRDAGEGDDSGIIGRLKGDDTKRLASTAYWSILRNLNILHFSEPVPAYCRHLAEMRVMQRKRSIFHADDDVTELTEKLWEEVPASGDSPTSLELTHEEAVWLRDRFLTVDKSGSTEKSLVTWLLDRNDFVPAVAYAWGHPLARNFPAGTAEVMWLGRDLDCLVHGARIVYNLHCARGREEGSTKEQLNQRYEQALRDWRDELNPVGPPTAARLSELNSWAEVELRSRNASAPAQIRWRTTYLFLRSWREIADDDADLSVSTEAAELIRRREASLKPGRARLKDRELLQGWPGDSGYLRFDYNWGVTNRILGDIHQGLGSRFLALGSNRDA